MTISTLRQTRPALAAFFVMGILWGSFSADLPDIKTMLAVDELGDEAGIERVERRDGSTREVLPADVAAAIARHRVAVLPASPTFLNLLLAAGVTADLTSLRVITYGTEPMPESLLARLKATFPQVRFIQTFGTSETGITHTVRISQIITRTRICV